MSEDLHDIDKLFQSGIDGHKEEVPPSVWEAVSTDLNKNVALHYRKKYRQLQGFSLLLILICISGGAYFFYDILNDRQMALVQKNSKSITPTLLREERKGHYPASPNRQGKLQEPAKIGEKNVTVADGVAGPSSQLSSKKQVEHQLSALLKQSMHDEYDNSQNLLKTEDAYSKKYFSPESLVQEISTLKRNKIKFHQPSSVSHQALHVDLFPLRGKDYGVPTINLQALPLTPAFKLPQANASVILRAKTAHGFSLSAFAAPNISFDRLEDDKHLAGPGRNRQHAKRNENKNISLSGGLLLNYELGKNVVLQSGISVRSSVTSISPTTVYAKADNNGHNRYELHYSSGYVYITPKGNVQPAVGDSAKTTGTTSRLMYVSIPLGVNYRVTLDRFLLWPYVGAGLNILTSAKTNTSLSNAVNSERTTTSISGLKPVYLDWYLGLGIEYGLNQKLSIGIRPNVRFALTPINKGTPVKSYQNILSVETGVRFAFKQKQQISRKK